MTALPPRSPRPLRGFVAALTGLLLAAPAAVRADVIAIDTATSVTFNFNSLPDGASNNAVQNHLQAQWTAAGMGGTVQVHGARGEANYTGDAHVVGPVNGNSVTPWTLGRTDGGAAHAGGMDTFLVNHGSDRITIVFPEAVFGVSFDFEIFPNAEVPDGRGVDPSCYPDFSFRADGELVFRTLGVMPGTDGTFLHSPFSGLGRPELAPQFLGSSGMISFPNGVTRLEFVDWPVLIGIDNLQVITSVTTTPEPSSVIVLGAALAGLFAVYRRRKPVPHS